MAQIEHLARAGGLQLPLAKAWQVEMKPVALAGNEQVCAARVLAQERVAEFRTHLIARLLDRWPDGGADAAPLRAQRLHALECAQQNAPDGALPAGMRRADHARLWV